MYTQGAACQRCVDGRYDNAIRHDCFPSTQQAVGYAAALWFHRFGLRLEDKVAIYIAPSRFVQRRLAEWGFPPERIALVRNFTTPPDSVAPIGEHGLYLGRLSDEKGVDVLLRALARLGDPPFDIAGDGPAAGRLRALAQNLGLRRVRFAGSLPVTDVPAAIERARFVVFPSTWDENAPLAALESMGRGRPIVASAAGGLPELAEDGRGRLVPPGNVAALAEAITSYADPSGRRSGRGASSGLRARVLLARAAPARPARCLRARRGSRDRGRRSARAGTTALCGRCDHAVTGHPRRAIARRQAWIGRVRTS